ncbi:MAG: DUF305 domain-containing protein [Rubrobacter sp.]|nr:DUF305 domain-containing protein [Rubrobacter sp.]
MRTRNFVAAGVLALLVTAGAGAAYAHQEERATTGSGPGQMMGERGMQGGSMDRGSMGPMMSGDASPGGGMMSSDSSPGGGMMGTYDEDEPFDRQYIDQMVMHHEGAIVSSQHMISDSERPELRQLAEDITESQSEQIELMQGWREDWYGSSGESSGMSSMMDERADGHGMGSMMNGGPSDVMFLRMMIPHHQLGIEMAEEALEESDRPEVRDLSRGIIEEQEAEIELMRGYLEEIEASHE